MPAGFRFTEGGHVDGDQEEKQVPYENIRISYLPPSEGGENGGLYGLWGSGAFGLKSDVALTQESYPSSCCTREVSRTPRNMENDHKKKKKKGSHPLSLQDTLLLVHEIVQLRLSLLFVHFRREGEREKMRYGAARHIQETASMGMMRLSPAVC